MKVLSGEDQVSLIKRAVALEFGVMVEDMEGPSHERELVLPRRIAIYLCRQLLSMTYWKLAHAFNQKSHRAAMDACDAMRYRCCSDSAFAIQVGAIRATLVRKLHLE